MERASGVVRGARVGAEREGEEGQVPRKEEGHWRELVGRLGEVERWLERLASRAGGQ